MPASLEMLTAAAESAARTSDLSTVEDLLAEPSHFVDGTGVDTSFEHELSEFLGIGSYGMMDVWAPLDDNLRAW